MTAATLSILADRAKRREMSFLGASDSRARFSLDAIVSQYEKLYLTSLAN